MQHMWTASLSAKQEVAELQDDIASPARFRSRHYCNKENGSKHRLPHAGLDAALATWFILRIPHAEQYEDCIYLILAYDLLSSWGWQLQDNRIFGRLQRRLIHCLSQHLECHLASVLTKELPRPTSEHQFHPATKTFGHRNLHLSCSHFEPCTCSLGPGTVGSCDASRSRNHTWPWSGFFPVEEASLELVPMPR